MKVELHAIITKGRILLMAKFTGKSFADVAKKAQDYIFGLTQDQLSDIDHFTLVNSKTGAILGCWKHYYQQDFKEFSFVFY